MRDVPEHDVRVLDGLIVGVDRWDASRRPGHTCAGASRCTPSFDVLVCQRPQLAVVVLDLEPADVGAAGIEVFKDQPLVIQFPLGLRHFTFNR